MESSDYVSTQFADKQRSRLRAAPARAPLCASHPTRLARLHARTGAARGLRAKSQSLGPLCVPHAWLHVHCTASAARARARMPPGPRDWDFASCGWGLVSPRRPADAPACGCGRASPFERPTHSACKKSKTRTTRWIWTVMSLQNPSCARSPPRS